MAQHKNQVQLLRLDNIMVDHELQSRDTTHPDYVHDFSDGFIAGVVFPPLHVFFDGKHYWLADGFHRHQGAINAGLTDIRCEIHHGSRRDAMIFSAGANRVFSIPRSLKDKQKAARMLFADEEWFPKEAIEIAAHVGIKTIQVHVWRHTYCKHEDIKTLAVDRAKVKMIQAREAPTPAQILDRERIAWEMSLEGKTHREIAERLAMSRGAVSHLLARLEARAREKLDAEMRQQPLPFEQQTAQLAASPPLALPAPAGGYTSGEPACPGTTSDDGSLDEFDPASPLSSALRMMVRGSSLDRLERESGVSHQVLYPFRDGGDILLSTADRLAVAMGLRLAKGGG